MTSEQSRNDSVLKRCHKDLAARNRKTSQNFFAPRSFNSLNTAENPRTHDRCRDHAHTAGARYRDWLGGESVTGDGRGLVARASINQSAADV